MAQRDDHSESLRMYNDGTAVNPSSIDQHRGANTGYSQLKPHHILEAVLYDVQPNLFFTNNLKREVLPANSGKEIKGIRYIPTIHDEFFDTFGVYAREALPQIQRQGFFTLNNKDLANISDKDLPIVDEKLDKSYYVGMRRVPYSGTFKEYALSYKWTYDAEAYDSDPKLKMREQQNLMTTAAYIHETTLANEFRTSIRNIFYAGSATSKKEVKEVVSYYDLLRTLSALRLKTSDVEYGLTSLNSYVDSTGFNHNGILLVHPDAINYFHSMKNYHDNAAFVPATGNVGGTRVIGSVAGYTVVTSDFLHPEFSAGGDVQATKNLGLNTRGVPQKLRSQNGTNADLYPFIIFNPMMLSMISPFFNSNSSLQYSEVPPKRGAVSCEYPIGTHGVMTARWESGVLVRRPELGGIIYSALPV